MCLYVKSFSKQACRDQTRSLGCFHNMMVYKHVYCKQLTENFLPWASSFYGVSRYSQMAGATG